MLPPLDLREKIMAELRAAAKKPELMPGSIDDIFSRYGITDMQERIKLLQACAGDSVWHSD